MTTLYPLRFVPVYQNYMWGGRRFETSLGRTLPSDDVYAESWELADHPDAQSTVEAGSLAGTTLRELMETHGEELMGKHHPRPCFPLLLKYLDACKNLSVQVHPDDATARKMGLSDPGKTEAWLIVEAEPGSTLWAGFNQPLDAETMKAALEAGDLEQYLHAIQPEAGDCLFIPAGTVHALGAGLLVAEIQQMSNNTFRLSDWNRVGPDGKPRQLHVAEGVEATDYSQGPVQPQIPQPTDQPGVERIVECDQFVLDRRTLDEEQTIGGDQRCHILTVIDGSVTVDGDPTDRPLQRGDTILLPAELAPTKFTATSDQPAILMDTYLP